MACKIAIANVSRLDVKCDLKNELIIEELRLQKISCLILMTDWCFVIRNSLFSLWTEAENLFSFNVVTCEYISVWWQYFCCDHMDRLSIVIHWLSVHRAIWIVRKLFSSLQPSSMFHSFDWLTSRIIFACFLSSAEDLLSITWIN